MGRRRFLGSRELSMRGGVVSILLLYVSWLSKESFLVCLVKI